MWVKITYIFIHCTVSKRAFADSRITALHGEVNIRVFTNTRGKSVQRLIFEICRTDDEKLAAEFNICVICMKQQIFSYARFSRR